MADPIPADDRGLLLGDGLFETLLADAGQLHDLDLHVARMARGCEVLGLPPPRPDQLLTAASKALRAKGLLTTRAAVRLTWTAGSGGRGLDRPDPLRPRLIATAAASPAPTTPARLATAALRRNHHSPLARLKSLAYLDNVLARRQAQAAGADEALILNLDGQVAGAAAANLFWLQGKTLFTPALTCGVLDGIVRARVIEAAPGAGLNVREVGVGAEALAACEAAFLTNSLIGLRSVVEIDGRPVAESALVARLAQLMQLAVLLLRITDT